MNGIALVTYNRAENLKSIISTILEDDLMPRISNWFEMYKDLYLYTGIHHLCRVQDKQIPEVIPEFTNNLKTKGLIPIYGTKPRGDFIFITKEILRKVGGFNPEFKGAGFSHIEWQNRIIKAGLIPHPNKWIDIRSIEHGDYFEQIGDTSGGRWNEPEKTQKEIECNRQIYQKIKHNSQIYQPLILI